MAFEKTNKTTGNNKPKANGFLNLAVRDATGQLHTLRAGIPLYEDNNLENSIIQAAIANGEKFTIEAVGTVKVITPESEKEAVEFAAPVKAKAATKK